MHVLSHDNRSEFLAVPQLVRFDYAKGRDGFEPTLLLKGSTLLLKYVLLGVPMQLAFAMIDGALLCALRVCDDGDSGGILWSFVEREEELNAIRGLAKGEPLACFLFNEIAVNVAWNDLPSAAPLPRLEGWADIARLGRIDHSQIKPAAKAALTRLHAAVVTSEEWIVFEVGGKTDWKKVRNTFITNGALASLIDIFDKDEGNQQEEIGVWLTDNLQPTGVWHGPEVPTKNQIRELTDILLSYEFGSILIESKTLALFSRGRLPDRRKLKKDVAAHVHTAFGQLKGAIKSLKSGIVVTSKAGEVLKIERDIPAHAIVLIPDLELLDNHKEFGIELGLKPNQRVEAARLS